MKISENVKKPLQLYHELLEEVISPESLRTCLMDLYYNYSRLVIKDMEENKSMPENIENELFYLYQLIKVCDPKTEKIL